MDSLDSNELGLGPNDPSKATRKVSEPRPGAWIKSRARTAHASRRRARALSPAARTDNVRTPMSAYRSENDDRMQPVQAEERQVRRSVARSLCRSFLNDHRYRRGPERKHAGQPPLDLLD